MIRAIINVLLARIARYKLNRIVSSLEQLLENRKIGYVDIGAAGGLEPRWKSFASLLKIFAFKDPLMF